MGSSMVAQRAADYEPPEFTLQKLQEVVRDMRAHVMCQICIRPMYEPYTIACGHTFCYSCLAQWFASHYRNKTCPECRTKVWDKPAPAYVLREMVQLFVSHEALLQDSETLVEHYEHREAEARIIETDRLNDDPRTGGIFRGCFRTRPRRMGGIIDYEDGGIARCPNCTWELEGGFCAHCGIPVYDELEWSDDDGSMSNASESLEEMRTGTYSSDYDSVESDEAQEFGTTAYGHRPRLGRSLRRSDYEIAAARWGDGIGGYDHVHDRRDHDDAFSDQEIYSVGSTANAGEHIAIGESEASNADSDINSESDASSMRSFLEDDEHSSDYEHAFPADDTSWPVDSHAVSSHVASNLQNGWSDAHDDEHLENDQHPEDGEPTRSQTDGYASSNRLSTPDNTYHRGAASLRLASTPLPQNPSSVFGASSPHQSSSLQLRESGTIASDSEESEASLPPPPQRNRKRRHVVEDESSCDSNASDLDTRPPRKRKSSSQDTTSAGLPSHVSRAQGQSSHPPQHARGSQPSPIIVDLGPARPGSPSQARHRHGVDRPWIPSHLRISALDGTGGARSLRNAEEDALSSGRSRLDRLYPKAAVESRQGEPQRRNEGMVLRM